MTAIGHGIWLLGAAAVRAIFSQSAKQAGRPCPSCHAPASFVGGECRACGVALRTLSYEEDRQAVKRQLRWLLSRKSIGEVQFEELSKLFDGQLRSDVPAPAAFSAVATADIVFVPPAAAIPSPEAMSAAVGASPFQAKAREIAAAAPLAAEIVALAPAPKAPRASLADLLSAFMERRNIRWVELVSGMLIVGSFIGLVISLRTTFSEVIPYFPALMFMLGAGFFHFVGLYTLHRWKLQSTSRAILIIATLLVPLSFMASIVLSRAQGQGALEERWYWPAVVLGLAGFGAMNYFASRALLGRGWWRLMAAVMGASAGQLIVNRVVPEPTAWLAVNAAFALPLASFIAAIAGQIGAALATKQLSRRRVEQMFLVLGVALFGLLVALGLLISRTHGLPLPSGPSPKIAAARMLVAQLSPSLCLAAALILGAGLVIHERAMAKTLVGQRMAGTAIALFAGALMGACVLLAWPAPVLLVGVGVAGFLTLTILGYISRLPMLHASGLACLSLACLVGFQLATGNIELWASVSSSETGKRLIELTFTGLSSAALLGLAAIVGAGALVWRAADRLGEARAYRLGAAALGFVSLSIACYVAVVTFLHFSTGPGAPLATLVLAIGAVGLLAFAYWRPSPDRALAGGALLWLALAHGLATNPVVKDLFDTWRIAPDRPVLIATMGHAMLLISLVVARGWRLRSMPDRRGLKAWSGFVVPLTWMSLASATLALPFIWLIRPDTHAVAATRLACLAMVWLAAAVVHRSRAGFSVFQVLASATLFFGLLAGGRAAGIWNGWPFDPAFAALQIAALALFCALFSGLRLAISHTSRGQWLRPQFDPASGSLAWPTVDQALLGSLAVGFLGLMVYAAAPGVAVEFEQVARKASVWGTMRFEEAIGPRGWLAWAVLAIAFVASLRERRSTLALAGLIVLAAAAACLIGARSSHPATVLGWTIAGMGLAVSAAFWSRETIGAVLSRLGFSGPATSESVAAARVVALVIFTLPVLLLASGFVARELASTADLANVAFIDGLMLVAIHLVPVAAIGATWLGHAARERKTSYAALGAGVHLACALLVFWFVSLTIGRRDGPTLFAGALQWWAIALALYLLAWIGLRKWIEAPQIAPTEGANSWTRPLGICLAASLFPLYGLVVLAVWRVGFHGAASNGQWLALGDWPAHAALLTTLAATLAATLQGAGKGRRLQLAFFVPGFAVGMAAFGAASAMRFDAASNTYGYWLLTAAFLAIAAALAAFAGALPSGDWRTRALAMWSAPLGALVVLLALVGYDNAFKPWTVLILAGISLVAAGASIVGGKQRWAYAAMALVLATVYVYWLKYWPTSSIQGFVELCQLWLLAMVLSAGAFLAAAMRRQRAASEAASSAVPPAHQFFTVGAILGALALSVGGLLIATLQRQFASSSTGGSPDAIHVSNVWGWILCVNTTLLVVAGMWDRRQKLSALGLYACGALALVVALDMIAFPPRQMLFGAGFFAAGYVALTGYLWSQGARLATWAFKLGIQDPIAGLKRTAAWLPALSLIVVAAVLAVEFVVVLSFADRWMRYCAALAPLLLAFGIACQAQEKRRAFFQWTTLVLLGLAAVFIAWADVAPGFSGARTLDRLARLVTSLSVAALGFLLAGKWRIWAGDWREAAGRAAFTAGGAALLALLFSISAEAALFNPATGAPVSVAQASITGAALAGLVIALLWLAINKGADPLGLTGRGRMAYVYAAQVIAVLLWGHIYLVFPEFFHGRVRPYWPYVAMAIAFGGVGLAELLKKRQVLVLAEPLERTSVFLPIVPMLGMWVIAAEKTENWVVLFMAGLLYALLAVFRRSFASALAAAVTGNAGLLLLLHEQGFRFLERPQFWMIPPALSVLGAAEANRKRLNEAQLTSVRYGCLLAIYVSSSCEIFLVSAGHSLASPMILAAAAVAGVVTGIWLRVRAFLYLGAGFVLVSVVSMVWHAQRTLEQSWPWWAFGMGLGASIMAVFVMFERKRGEILGVIDRLKQWQK